MTRVNWRDATVLGLCLALLVASGGCSERPKGPERVVARLGPADFGVDWAMPRPAVAQLGDEARPVLAPPPRRAVAEDRAVFVHDGVARVTYSFPQDLLARPDENFELLVLPLPWEVPMDDATLATFRENGRFERRSAGWRLRRSGDEGRVVVEIDEADAKQLVVSLEAIGDASTRLESRPLELAAGDALVLGFGTLVPEKDIEYRFRAAFDCDGTQTELFAAEVDGKALDRWQSRTVRVPTGVDGCRLVLDAEREGGTGIPGGVWSVPLVLGHGAPEEPVRPNLVLISLDTLRADHMSGYGYARETTPRMDRELLEKGTVFLDATSTFPRTDVSHLSLVTATYPSAQPRRGRLEIGSPIATVAERLQDAGYETWAFGEGGLFGGPYGFWHGYDRFTEFPYDSDERGVGVFREGAAALEALAGRPFFLTLHTYKTHDPWTYGAETADLWTDADAWTSGELDERVRVDLRDDVDAYDRTIREADTLVAGFLRALDESGLGSQTVVVLVSDHGEAFGEHGITSHGYGFGQEQLHVPLVFRGPGVEAGRRVDTPVSLVDVAPTLIDLGGAEPFDRGQGLSLVPALRGGTVPDDRPLFFAWIQPASSGYRKGSQKVARAKGVNVIYDLAKDPLESGMQRAGRLPDAEFHVMNDHLAEAAMRRDETSRRTITVEVQEPITDKMKESLKALGYVE